VRRLLLSSAVAAIVAALAGGAAEVLSGAESAMHAGGGIGFLALFAIPLGWIASIAGRLLWKSWRPVDLVAGLRDPETGGAPRLAAWILYLLAAGVLVAAAVLQGMNVVTMTSSARVVYALAAPILALLSLVVVAALSRPSVAALAFGLGRLDRAWFRRRGAPLLGARRVASAGLAVAVGLVAVAWFATIKPHIGHFDVSFVPSLVTWASVLALAPLGWSALAARPRLRASLVAATGTAAIAAIATALWLRYQRPYAMLEIWGESQVAGTAIDWLYDIESLRGELRVEGIAPVPQPGALHHDLVLVTIDTMRADRTPLYGGPAEMPALGSLATRAAVFDWAFSPGNVTRRSLPAMAIGVSAPRLRGRVAGWALKLDPRHILLAERLRAAGYQTAGFFCCASQFAERHRLGLIRGIDSQWIDKDGERLATMAGRWLRERQKQPNRKPLFVWLHFIEPHGWEKSHPATGGPTRKRAERYDRALTDADRALAILLDAAWKEPAQRERTFLVITSDHGEGLGDHGHRNHAASLYNSEIQVPLVIGGPGISPRRIARPVGLHDLAPTLLDLAGYVPPGMPAMDGVSIAGVLRGTAATDIEAGEAYAAMIEDRSVATDQRALVVGRWKLIATDGSPYQLYDLVADPDEKRNLFAQRPEIAARLRKRLAERRRIDRQAPF
jgi:arylsulfatase A-like enzyme